MDYFTPGEALRILSDERCTHMCGVDTMFVDMLGHESYPGLDLSSVRTGWTVYNEAVFEAFPGMMNVYALSECASTVAISDAGDDFEKRRDTCGRPLEGLEVRILDPETNAEQPAETPGRIVVRGWCTTSGYYKQPDLNARLFIDGDWLDTGDYGKKLTTGEIVYLGRLKDVLRVGGENVASVEVEAVLNSHPAVLRSAIVPVAHIRLGEVPCAFVLLRDEMSVTEAELDEHCRQRLANFKVPRHFIFVTEFPMTGSGKIQKTLLVDQAEAAFGSSGRRA
jgi:fatty-acyl-CoA synthase